MNCRDHRAIFGLRSFCFFVLVCSLFVALPVGASAREGQKSYATPEKAVQGLVTAVKAGTIKKLGAIFGPGSETLVSSGDAIADRSDWNVFVQLYEEKHRLDLGASGSMILVIGAADYPFPIPLVHRGKRWVFDATAGKEEIINRRIGNNELNAIAVAHAYVAAQHEYAAKDRDNDGFLAFAQKFQSTPGKKDGLYWFAKEGEEESPFGPLAARAAQEGYAASPDEERVPFHGYFFKVLKRQDAEDGAFEYIVDGRMTLGFALLAYPAQYGASGIMSFIVNQNSIVYQKDLGPDTAKAVGAMTTFTPDVTWERVP